MSLRSSDFNIAAQVPNSPCPRALADAGALRANLPERLAPHRKQRPQGLLPRVEPRKEVAEEAGRRGIVVNQGCQQSVPNRHHD